MVRHKRMPRISRVPYEVLVDGKVAHKVYTEAEFDKILKRIDRKKHKVRLK